MKVQTFSWGEMSQLPSPPAMAAVNNPAVASPWAHVRRPARRPVSISANQVRRRHLSVEIGQGRVNAILCEGHQLEGHVESLCNTWSWAHGHESGVCVPRGPARRGCSGQPCSKSVRIVTRATRTAHCSHTPCSVVSGSLDLRRNMAASRAGMAAPPFETCHAHNNENYIQSRSATQRTAS